MLISILATPLKPDTCELKCCHAVYAIGRGKKKKIWRCTALSIKIIQVWVPKYKGENHTCCFGFCEQQKMPFSTELNDEEVIFSLKKSRGRWLHTNSLGIISIVLLCQSQHRLACFWVRRWLLQLQVFVFSSQHLEVEKETCFKNF